MSKTKVSTTGDRFSVTVHVKAEHKFLGRPTYAYTLIIRDEQEAKAAEEWIKRSSGFAMGYGHHQPNKNFETDDPRPLIDVLRAAADALEAEVRA